MAAFQPLGGGLPKCAFGVQKAFDKQARILAGNLLHHSLRAKKFSESKNLWQARVSKDWRFYFKIEADAYIIVRIVPHPK